MLISDTHWIWDSWIVDDGEAHHLFYLQAPRALGDPDERHLAATVGHARSRDLVSWEVLPEALAPTPGSWDDVSIWTGSTVRGDDGRWRMFYTATSSRGHGVRDQRIGVAESDDLLTWHKVGTEPLLVADPRWYRTLPEDAGASETWRDPQVLRDPEGPALWHMLITARVPTHDQHDDGVLAHAWSSDLRTWEVGSPLTTAGHGFGQLEVAQVRRVEGRWVLGFTCEPTEISDARRGLAEDCCTFSVPGEPGGTALGPWDIGRARPFTASPDLFAAPLVQRRDGTWALLGFHHTARRGEPVFEISDPIPVGLDADGYLEARHDGAVRVHPSPTGT